MEETLILLKFNCPDANCDYIGNGWADLKLHARAVHSRLMWFVLSSIMTGRLFSDSVSGYSPVTCVLGTRRFSHMNMHSIQRTSSQSIYPLCTIDMSSRSPQKKWKEVYTLFANSAMNASSESTSTIVICERGMKNVSSVNGMAHSSNSKYFIWIRRPRFDVVAQKLPEL